LLVVFVLRREDNRNVSKENPKIGVMV